jgi:energy-coupling factor transporter ATP-binding protein EcfA2
MDSFQLTIPLTSGESLPMVLDKGTVLFALGANGSGKSTLIHHIFAANATRARRISAHRQTWFDSGAVSITGQQRQQTEMNILSWDSGINARWREEASGQRTNMAVFDLVDAQNVRSRAIADAVDNDDFDLARELRWSDAPLKVLNEILRLSAIPIEVSLRTSDELVASKNGGAAYSIAELSDGERNVLLLAANVLTAKPGTLLLIDEPERHIHRSISSPLLSLLIGRKPDCTFVVSTHEVMLPLDTPNARTLLVRSCSRRNDGNIGWDVDLLEQPPPVLDERLVGDILGAKRTLLFVEGTKLSLDLPLYALLFPKASVIPRASCRDVEQAVVGIRAAEGMHWLRAYGIVDGDARPGEELARLAERGVHVLRCYSIESVYYSPDLQRHVARRQAAVVDGDAEARLSEAKQAALRALKPHKQRLSERVAEKSVREAVFKLLPNRQEIATGTPIKVEIDVASAVQAEANRFETALAAGDLAELITRYPVRETPALAEIAVRLGFQNRSQYEAAVRKMFLDEADVLKLVRDQFGILASELA